MKISSVAATILAFAPLIAAGGLKGADRQLQGQSPPTPNAPPGSWSNSPKGKAGEQPTLEDLNEIYGTFCEICDFVTQLDDLLGIDASFCGLCDVITEIPDPADFQCFSGKSTVQLMDGTSTTMKDLKIGDNVLTQSGAYEPVYAFGHKNPTLSTEFLQFKTKETTLEMTGGHLVFLDGKTNPVRADSIQVGDVFQGENAKVTKIGTVTREGVYTPLTPSGTVVVDGITASSYISLQKGAAEFAEFQGGISSFVSFQDIIHMALSPFRMFTMGVSSSLGNVYTEAGIPLFASYGMDLAQWADGQNIVVQFFMALAFFAIAGASMVVENTFGPSMAPLALAAGAGAYALMNKSGLSVRANKIKSV